MGRLTTTCATLAAMLLLLGCAATVSDPPPPGERIIAGEIRREWLATCLDHHLRYAEPMARFMGTEATAQFAISRCAGISREVHADPIIDFDGPWEPATADELESCKSIAYADLRRHPRSHTKTVPRDATTH